jgi:dihydrodipicolinate synthase/N-acetylneuraminate lyase
LAAIAKELGATGITVAVPSNNDSETYEYFKMLTEQQDLPLIIYNTESKHIQSLETVQKLNQLNDKILAIKDSSDHRDLFAEICKLRVDGTLNLSILEGMENRLKTLPGCDGYLISLLNLEPELCRVMLEKNDDETNRTVYELFHKYNLGADWFVSIKAFLCARGVIASSEQVNPELIFEL